MTDDQANSKKQKRSTARSQGLSGILANAASTTGKSGSMSRKDSILELRCKKCGAPRQGEDLFVCTYCGESLV